jgi:hypothetical protein
VPLTARGGGGDVPALPAAVPLSCLGVGGAGGAAQSAGVVNHDHSPDHDTFTGPNFVT